MTGAPLRILLAGCGAFGLEHLGRLAARDDVRLAGAADPDPAARERVRSLCGIACHADALKMIDATEADAIIVATPAATHVEIAAHALRRGLPALVEKPVAASAPEAARLAALAGERAFVLPGHVLRFSKDHQTLVEIARSGTIGAVLYVNSRRYRDDSHAVRYADADPVLTTLVHDIDLAQWVTNSSFHSVLARRFGGPGYHSLTAASAVAATGAICDLRTTWTFTDGDLPPDRLEVVGERGGVELSVGESLWLYRDGLRRELPLAHGDDALANEQDHFLACVRDQTLAPALGLTEALAGLKLADAALQSLRTGSEVVLTEAADIASGNARA